MCYLQGGEVFFYEGLVDGFGGHDSGVADEFGVHGPIVVEHLWVAVGGEVLLVSRSRNSHMVGQQNECIQSWECS